MDCALQFEQAVAALPGVARANLNPITGRLTIEGTADLAAIAVLGREHNYTVTLCRNGALPAAQGSGHKRFITPLMAGASLASAYLLEQGGGAMTSFLPLYLIAITVGGWNNFKKAFWSLRQLRFTMSVLMSAAVIGALAIDQYEEGAVVSFLYCLSDMLENWSMEAARRSIRQLMDIAARTAVIRRSGGEITVPVEAIAIGDIMIIRPGEKVAMDGIVIKGESAVNQAAITGESIPAEKSPASEVYAGTLNTYGTLEIEITKTADDTAIAKIIHLVEEAQAKQAPSQAFVERFAALYTPIIMALAAIITLFPPLFLGGVWSEWLYRGLALLVVACPCALVVSTPVAIVSAITCAARNGVLIKGGIYLEAAGSLRAIAFDKTGTLTQGSPAVTDIISLSYLQPDEVLAIAADLEQRSSHPIAKAITAEARRKGYEPQAPADSAELPGQGVRGTVGSAMTYVGKPRLFASLSDSSHGAADIVADLERQGKTVMIAGTDAALYGIIAVADEVRTTSKAALAALKRAGIERIVMLTGDNPAISGAIAASVGIDEYQASLMPGDKVKAVEQLISRYDKVAMVGDGINDAPALALATVGIAMGGAGSDTALETADIVLMADDLGKLPFTITLSRQALEIIRQNITFSLIIKAIAVLAVFPGWLTLWLAILADMGATLIVTLNSLRLLRVGGEV